jgi:purine-binding chemotaxis protein CheW
MSPNSEAEAQSQQALVQFVVFAINNEEYAVPIAAVAEVVPSVDVIPVPGAPTYILGLMNLRGKVIPVLDLQKKFNIGISQPTAHQHIIVAESAQHTLFGVVVDYVEQVLKISDDKIKPVPEAVKDSISAEYIGGVIVITAEQDSQKSGDMADERMLLILDLQKIISDADAAELRTVQAPQAAPAPINNEGDTA